MADGWVVGVVRFLGPGVGSVGGEAILLGLAAGG